MELRRDWPIVVRFDYAASSPDELTVARGEVLLRASAEEEQQPGERRSQPFSGHFSGGHISLCRVQPFILAGLIARIDDGVSSA